MKHRFINAMIVYVDHEFSLQGAAQRLALPAKAGFGGKMPKGQKSQWCESTQKRRTTPLLSGASGVGRLSYSVAPM
jgi:hypothetical protein